MLHMVRIAFSLLLAFPLMAGISFAQQGALHPNQGKVLEATGGNPVEADFTSGGLVRMNLCSSGVSIKGTNKDRLRVTFLANASSSASDVHVRLRTPGNSSSSNSAELQIQGCPHNNFKITVEVPKTSDLHVRMFAGQLEVAGVTGNKDLEMHAGQLDVEINKVSEYAHVDGSVNTGQVDAQPWDTSKGGLFRSFSKEGSGKYRLHAHVGAGQITFGNAQN
jgi:hypothetical protein